LLYLSNGLIFGAKQSSSIWVFNGRSFSPATCFSKLPSASLTHFDFNHSRNQRRNCPIRRAKADDHLAQTILNSDPVDFLTTWLAQPLFQGIANKGQDFIAHEILRRLPLNPSGLACSLKYFSNGVMPSAWHQLIGIKTPTLVIAGSRDQNIDS
jgi:hypothetical protein